MTFKFFCLLLQLFDRLLKLCVSAMFTRTWKIHYENKYHEYKPWRNSKTVNTRRKKFTWKRPKTVSLEQNVSKYHLNFQNDLKKLTCRFVTHNLRKKFKYCEKSTTRPKMATKCVSATNLVQTNLKHAQNVSRYYLSFQNDLANPKCRFVTHNLPKRLKKAFQDQKWQPSATNSI